MYTNHKQKSRRKLRNNKWSIFKIFSTHWPNDQVLFIADSYGDFNGETGKRNYINECLGNVSQGIRIKSDQHIVNFCAQQNLKISNTYFHHKQIIMVTWKQTGNVQNKVQKLSKTLDFICVQRKHIQLLQNSRLYHRTISTSDNK